MAALAAGRAFALDRCGESTLDLLYCPSQVAAQLDKYVIGQDRAKRILAVAVFNHYHRITHAQSASMPSSLYTGGAETQNSSAPTRGREGYRRDKEREDRIHRGGEREGERDGRRRSLRDRDEDPMSEEPDPTKIHSSETWDGDSPRESPAFVNAISSRLTQKGDQRNCHTLTRSSRRRF